MTTQTDTQKLKKGSIKLRSGRYAARMPFWNGKQTRYVHIGTFDTPEEAAEAIVKYQETGERQLRGRVTWKRAKILEQKPKGKKERKRRAFYIMQNTIQNGERWYVFARGWENGKRVRPFVGVFESPQEAEKAGEKYVLTGEVGKRSKRGPKVRIEDIKIAPGRNLRDQEVECLKRHKPELMGADPRARRPGESVGDWCRRLEVLKGYRAA